MHAYAGAFDIKPFEKAANRIKEAFADSSVIAVTTAGKSRGYPGRSSLSSRMLSQTVAKALQQSGVKSARPQDVKIIKTEWGLPFICLPGNLEDQAVKTGIKNILVSSTNDQGKVLCVAAALQKKTTCPLQPLGIGVDMLFYSTARHLLADCPQGELEQMFSVNELIEAFGQPDEESRFRLLLKMLSVKEAVFKSLIEAFWHNRNQSLTEKERQGISFLDVEVTGTAAAKLKIRLLNDLQNIANIAGAGRIFVEIVNEENYCGALALAGRMIPVVETSEEKILIGENVDKK